MRTLPPALFALCLVVVAPGCDGQDVRALPRQGDERPSLRSERAAAERGEAAPLDAPEVGGAVLGAIPQIAERVVPSVVNVSAVRPPLQSDGEQHPFDDPFFRRFFGDPAPTQPEEQLEQTLGSGVIVDEKGVILTNNHVVEGAQRVLVTLTDGQELDAEVIGTDPQTDLAVLQLTDPPEGLVALPFGSSSSLRLGQTVLAVGDPFGVGQTVTMGIVSATGRSGMGIVDYEDFIQTDAAINPGNSGGALVNLKGELVGVPIAILSRTGGYQGIGFAIPSDMVKVILADLVEDGEVDRGFLGVQIQDINRALAEAMDLGTVRGALIAQVVEGGPAERAGLRAGDVIVAVDGEPVRSSQELKNVIGLMGSNVKTTLTVRRDGHTREVTVRLGAVESAEREELPPPALNPREQRTANLEGLELRELDETVRRRLRLPPALHGVVVTRVDPGTAPARAGLMPGDVVVELDRRPVTDVAQVSDRISDPKRDAVLLTVWRSGGRLFMALPSS